MVGEWKPVETGVTEHVIADSLETHVEHRCTLVHTDNSQFQTGVQPDRLPAETV